MYTAVFLFLPILTIQFDDVAALKYPFVVNMINVVEPIRRSQNQSGYIYKSLAEQRYEELKQRRNKLQQKRLNLDTFHKKHEIRMKTIIEHMEKYFMSSLYLYQEVERIRRTGQVMDKARELLKFIDEAGHTSAGRLIRSNFYVCYRTVKPTEKTVIWQAVDNNKLVIHTVKDPINDGVD